MKKLPIVLISMCLAVTIFMAVPAHAAGITFLKSSLYWNLSSSTVDILNNTQADEVSLFNTVSFTDNVSVSYSNIRFDSSLFTSTFTNTSDWYSQVVSFSDFNGDDNTTSTTQIAIKFVRPIVLTAGQTLEFYFYLTDCYFSWLNSSGVVASIQCNRYLYSTGNYFLNYSGPVYLYDTDGNNFYGDSNVKRYVYNTTSSTEYYNICYRAKYTCSDSVTISYFRIPLTIGYSIVPSTAQGFSFKVVGSPLQIYDEGYNPGFEEPTSPAESEIISGIDAVESQQNQMNQTLDDINDKLEETYVVPEPEILPGYDVDDLIGESEAVESASDLMEAVESSMNTEDMLSGSRFWQSLIAEIISVPGFAVMGMMSGGFLITKAFIGR